MTLVSPFMMTPLRDGARDARDDRDYTPGAAARWSDYRLQLPRSSSGGNGQGGGAAFGIEGVLDQLACFAFAAAAARGAAGAGLHVFERARAARDRVADVMVGNGLADADVHGGSSRLNLRRAPFERE